jgi:glycogen(starch) synthase
MTTPLRTLVLSREYPPYTVGGTSTVARSVAAGMVAQGHDVHVVTTNPRGDIDTVEDVGGVAVHRIGTALIYNDATELSGRVLATHRRLWRTADRILREYGPFDSMVMPDLFCFPEARLLATTHRLPLVNILLQDFAAIIAFDRDGRHHVTDGVSAHQYQLLSLEERALRGSDHTVFISHALSDAIVGRYPFVEPASSTIHLGVDLAEIDDVLADPGLATARERPAPAPTSGPTTPLIVACGRLVPVKGFGSLIEAMASLPRPARLVLVGVGPELASLRARAGEVGVGDRVSFLGDISRREALSLFAVADVNVVPSLWESFCYVCAEMMALGRPVVATTVDSLRELMPDDTVGYRVEVSYRPSGRRRAEPAGFVAAIERALADPMDAAVRAGRAATHIRTRFSNERFAAGVADRCRALSVTPATVASTGDRYGKGQP